MKKNTLFIIILALCLTIVLVACGPGGQNAGSTPLPTMTIIPTYGYTVPTEAPGVGTAAAATLTSAAAGQSGLDPVAVERGRGRYEALECGSCHGPNGEGTDKGSSMIEYTGTEEEFISFMRSGGELGPDHQYSTNRLSDSGGRNLYQYLLSIRAQTGP